MIKTNKDAFIKEVLINTILKENEKVKLCLSTKELHEKLNNVLATWTNEQNIALSKEWYNRVSEKCTTSTWQPLSLNEIVFVKIGSIISFTKEALITEKGGMKFFSVILLAVDNEGLKYRLGGSFGKVKASNYKNYFWMMKLSEEDQKILFWKKSNLVL